MGLKGVRIGTCDQNIIHMCEIETYEMFLNEEKIKQKLVADDNREGYHVPVTHALRRLTQEDHGLKASLGWRVRPCPLGS